MRGACCCWAVPTTPPSPSRAGIRRRCPPPRGGASAAAGIALRRLQAEPARLALAQARAAARESGIGALQAGADALSRLLEAPAARLTHHGAQRLLRLDEVEALMASDALVADTARQALRSPMATVDLSRRPVLFALARQLAEAWPGDAPREALIAAVFRLRRPDRPIAPGCGWRPAGCASRSRAWPRSGQPPGLCAGLPPGCEAVTLAPPDESAHPELQALLDGQPWSSAALAWRWAPATFGAACPANPGRRR